MVEKFRIESSIDLLHRHNELNKGAKVVTECSGDDIEIVEDKFSYNNTVFNTALHHEEREEDVHSAPPFMHSALPGMTEPQVSSAVISSACERPQQPAPATYDIRNKTLQWIKDREVLEQVHQLAIDWYVSGNLMIIFL